MITDSQLASECQGLAHGMCYDDPSHGNGRTKYVLEECSHRLDSHSIRVHAKADGLLMLNARGKSRYMTWRERLAYKLLGNKTEIRP